MGDNHIDQQLAGLAGLGDPLRRALYRFVAERGVPVSRDDAAAAAGRSAPLAPDHPPNPVPGGPPTPGARVPAARPSPMPPPPRRSSSACPPATTPPWPSCWPA